MICTMRMQSIVALFFGAAAAMASCHAEGESNSFLATVHRHATLASTIPDNGDLNPYAIFVAPVSAGKIQKDDVLVDNFNNISNLQGTGGTIILYTPSTKKVTLFTSIPQHLPQCPGGVGLSTAMTMLKSGWVIVGSAPSADGTMKTRGTGCLLVLDSNGKLVTAWSGPNINYPWGNMAVSETGDRATLFISMAGFDVAGPDVRDPKTGFPVTVNKATVLRMDLQISNGKAPVITSETVIADGLSERSDKDVFLVGPTGVVLGANDTLYVSDALNNRIVAVDQASTRTTSAGTGREVTRDGLLRRPLAMVMAPNGNLLTTNAKNGQVVEIDPVAGKQIVSQWIDANPAQSPPGNGDLFGIAMKPDGSGFYYVEDDVNTLVEAVR